MLALLLILGTASLSSAQSSGNDAINITERGGVEVTLPCTVTGLGPYDMVIWKSPTEIPLTYNERILSQDYSLPRKWASDWSLVIKNLKATDHGTFKCTVNGITVKQIVNLKVKAPPRIEDPSENKTVSTVVGDKVMIRCLSSGTPTPEVTWHRYMTDATGKYVRKRTTVVGTFPQIEISNNRNVTVLTGLGFTGSYYEVNNVQIESGGIYICVAQNSIGPSDERYFKVTVHFMPAISVKTGRIGRKLGETAVLKCTVKASPFKGVTWWLNGKQIVKNYKTTIKQVDQGNFNFLVSLNIKSVEKADFGVYTCKSLNTVGSAQGQVELYENATEKFAKILESSENQVLREKDKLELYCLATGYPDVTITWYKHSQNSSKQKVGVGKYFVKDKIVRDDDGIYVCEATNSQNMKDARNISVSVEFPPEVLVKPALPLILGNSMSLKCNISGNPRPQMLWQKIGDVNVTFENMFEITYEPNYKWTLVMTMKEMTADEEGKYQCIAENTHGISRKSTVIKMKDSIKATTSTIPIDIYSSTELEDKSTNTIPIDIYSSTERESTDDTANSAQETSGDNGPGSGSSSINGHLFTVLLQFICITTFIL